MRAIHCAMACAAMGVAATMAKAQVPFIYPGASSFDPEIRIINSGALLDAQAVVSPDRKYVTLNMRPTNTALLALREFSFQNGQNPGVVGIGPVNANNVPVDANNAPAPAESSILTRHGMVRIDRRK